MKLTASIAILLLSCSSIYAQTGITGRHTGHTGKRTLTHLLISETGNYAPSKVKNPFAGDKVPDERPEWLPADCDGIVYGESVSRNEFNIEKGIFPSPLGNFTAFYRKDESHVSSFPLINMSTCGGSTASVRYPMNGTASERITLGIRNNATGAIVYANVTDFTEERYLTNISWSPDDRYVFIQVLDRAQHNMHLNMYRSRDGSYVRTILTESNDAWVEPLDPIRFIDDSWNFIYRTDNRDGYRNLYLCDTLGDIRRLTCVNADVEVAAIHEGSVFYTSAEISPIENHLFRIDIRTPRNGMLKGCKFSKPIRLTKENGWHTITFDRECGRYHDEWSSLEIPREQNIYDSEGNLLQHLHSAQDPLAEYSTGDVILGTVKSADGKFDNYYRMVLPPDFDPSKKYPTIVYVYGGPHSQMVRNSWLASIRIWEMLMAERGYVMYIQDNRGTSNRGSDFEKAINRRCGVCEMADQMEGIKMLMACPWVDKERIGICGWSYGGFMTITMAIAHPEIFKAAASGGPVIDWKWYEVMYGERYMDNPETNPEGFSLTGLTGKAPELKTRLLICQGGLDGTVLPQNSLNFIQACIEADVPVDYFMYPASEHNVKGAWRGHLYQKFTEYFDTWLK